MLTSGTVSHKSILKACSRRKGAHIVQTLIYEHSEAWGRCFRTKPNVWFVTWEICSVRKLWTHLCTASFTERRILNPESRSDDCSCPGHNFTAAFWMSSAVVWTYVSLSQTLIFKSAVDVISICDQRLWKTVKMCHLNVHVHPFPLSWHGGWRWDLSTWCFVVSLTDSYLLCLWHHD